MSVNNISETQRKMNSVERKLMYKSHGQWAVKTTGTIALGALAASEADAIGETQNANEQLSEAVARTSQSIHEIGGKTITVSVKQTEGISI